MSALKQNIKAVVSYDGSSYLGWQKTKEGPSIQETIERVLFQIFQEEIRVQGASRTDAGVHAEGQVINFFISKSFNVARLKQSLNALLPPDIRILNLAEITKDFHPTLDAVCKEYHYKVCLSEILPPLYRHQIWHYSYETCLKKIEKAIPLFIGKKRFAALRNERNDQDPEDDLRNVFSITVDTSNEMYWKFVVIGDNFLYKMVRNLVGTLVYVGRGKIDAEEIPNILISRDRRRAGITAPAHGLSLHRIYYPADKIPDAVAGTSFPTSV